MKQSAIREQGYWNDEKRHGYVAMREKTSCQRHQGQVFAVARRDRSSCDKEAKKRQDHNTGRPHKKKTLMAGENFVVSSDGPKVPGSEKKGQARKPSADGGIQPSGNHTESSAEEKRAESIQRNHLRVKWGRDKAKRVIKESFASSVDVEKSRTRMVKTETAIVP
ncbi:MAG: hypothetical protein LC642_04565 [Verrucomicrobiaceae bacterium]|nr:hypothetical protein [Verrucomicrobiaceae bacterium]